MNAEYEKMIGEFLSFVEKELAITKAKEQETLLLAKVRNDRLKEGEFDAYFDKIFGK